MKTITRGSWTGQIAEVLNANKHNSEENAYLIADYPYGRLRCQKRVWLECNSRGTRLVSRTSNPKRGNDWRNATKASTYAELSGALYLDEQGHVQWLGLDQYADVKEAVEFLEIFGENCTNYKETARFVRLKVIFEEELAKFTPRPEYGTALFKTAYQSAIHRSRQEIAAENQKEAQG